MTFTSDWVTQFVPSWTKHLAPVLAGEEDVHWLEVGSYEGRSALWFLDNILQGKGSTITCVDLWQRQWMQKTEVEKNFDENLKGRTNLVKLVGRSDAILPGLVKGRYDGVYVDGSHEEADVYRDAEMCLPLLRPGAFMIFDDYENRTPPAWISHQPPVAPRQFGVYEAVNRFIAKLGDRITVLHKDWQLIARLSE